MPLKMHQEKHSKPLSSVKNIIAVAAGKGGVGKSSVAVNLALALKELGCSVGLMDADIYGPSVRKMLPEDHLPRQEVSTIFPAVSRGIEMISMAFFRRDNEAAVVRAPIANGLIGQFITNVAWGELDFLIMDFPPGTGDIQLSLCQQAKLNGAIMVTTPQDVAVMDVRKAMVLFEQVRIPVLGIIENMSYYFHEKTGETLHLFGHGGGKRLAQEKGVPFLGEIPIDPLLSRNGDLGKSIFADGREGKTVQAFLNLANRLMQVAGQPLTINVKNVTQSDPQTFIIEWSDGTAFKYCARDVQKVCPCAGCVDEQTQKSKVDEKFIQEGLQVVQIGVVGRYALKIRFSSGCSNGIYTFDMLKELARSLR